MLKPNYSEWIEGLNCPNCKAEELILCSNEVGDYQHLVCGECEIEYTFDEDQMVFYAVDNSRMIFIACTLEQIKDKLNDEAFIN